MTWTLVKYAFAMLGFILFMYLFIEGPAWWSRYKEQKQMDAAVRIMKKRVEALRELAKK